jgi:hypothetical protein
VPSEVCDAVHRKKEASGIVTEARREEVERLGNRCDGLHEECELRDDFRRSDSG